MSKIIGCSIIFYNDQRQVLLQLRDDIPTIEYPNVWDLLGGGVEEDEKPEEGIVREMKEELGMDIGIPVLFKATEFDDRTENTFFQKLNASEVELNITLTEGQRVKWFSEDEIKKMTLAFEFNSVIEAFFERDKFKW